MSDSSFDAQGALPLPHWAVLRASGPDAASFLQGQLTQSVTDLKEHEARLGGYCNVKGRLQAGFILCREDAETIDLLLPRELLAPLQKKLSMFVLRAKCKLAEAPSALHGLVGDAVPEDLPVWGRRSSLIRLPNALGQRRALTFDAPAGADTLALEAWNWLELHAGVAWVVAATSEHFVPQMINWELLGGVNFKKGCFPGQEVVARSQYRGTVKRRAQLLLGATAAPGSELLQNGESVGEVLMSAAWQGQAGLLAELQLAAWESDASITLPDGTVLQRGTLSYAVKAPE
ncbi:folate-binding protein YgfZ [Inhella sp.]|uniref:CAF17-like 4Fe-4S cluster assembly/insertion protein YgfZ n=1 Tax=Inhella sp. TaxID=1921806 RepID=UPI0035B47125